MFNSDITSILTERILRIENLLADSRSLETPGNYASGGVLFGSTGGKASVDGTNFVWDNTNKRLGIGTNAPAVRLVLRGDDNTLGTGPHMEFYTTTDIYPQIQVLPYTHDNINIALDARFDGTNWKSSDAGSNFLVRKAGDTFVIARNSGTAAGSTISTWTEAFGIGTDGFTRFGASAVRVATTLLSIANNGVAALGMSNFGFAFVHVSGAPALYSINGTVHTTTELLDPSASYTPTAGTAGSTNVYWSAGNNRYEIENKRGSTLNHRIWLFDAP